MTKQEKLEIEKYLLDRDNPNYEITEKVMKAVGKTVAKKPLYKELVNNATAWEWVCPNCRIVKVTIEKQFCDDCGQALDWSDNNA